ncbi:DUF262 domain-containing protein [Psychrobacter sp. 72-O-c]|uniref:DUF262 domain-containing protein n=1 Tax=Psychrobacter sp. 72-O-c TaxID=2774125 RepID=UPI00191B2B2E|nr:DUF262 domain-containing protein [Psychrobacter sp. 72-O-c]
MIKENSINEGYEVLKVARFLSSKEYSENKKLVIPVYQRPYRWTEENIIDLLTDLYYQCKRLGHNLGDIYNPDNAYRLGTVVLHQYTDEGGQTQVALVDGQQRTLTLLLLMKAAADSKRFKEQFNGFAPVEIELLNCSETQKNLSKNLACIERHVSSPEFTSEVLDFLLNHCEVVQVTLHDLSEAFQFFDSQNARGLDLSPHDLLKAFHLREFAASEDSLKEPVVNQWEQKNTKDLKLLFSNYLYPIRQWSLGKPNLYFSKSDIHVFKGVNLSSEYYPHSYPFQQGLKVIHNTVDNYNQHAHRAFDQQIMAYPFQITQTLINGRRFFDWVAHYQTLLDPLLNKAIEEKDDNWLKAILYQQEELQKSKHSKVSRPTALTIMQTIDNKKEGDKYKYSHWWRQGDRYVRRMFSALVLCYYDRFGEQDLARAIEYIFIWTYSLRLQNSSVYLESVEKHIRRNNLFMRLQQSLLPVDFLNKPLPQILEIKASNIEGIKTIFEELGYYTSEQVTETTNVQ